MTENLILEAKIDKGSLTGKEWEVTIIGPKTPQHLITKNGRQYIKSDNGLLYSVDALSTTARMWEGVKVYDDHLTNEEYERRQGMRSPNKEWLGSIVSVRWDDVGKKLKGVFKVVEESLARKLKNADEQGILNSIGLSIDTFIKRGEDIMHEGNIYHVAEGFKKVISVDLVGEPAAGGTFNRILAAQTIMEKNNMSEEQTEKEVVYKDDIAGLVSQAVADALAAQSEDATDDIEELDDNEVEEALEGRKASEAQKTRIKEERRAEAARREADLARTELMLERKLDKARLPEKFEEAVRVQFKDRVVEGSVIDEAIARQREAYASLDPTGRVKTGGIGEIKVGVEQDERFELAVMNRIMGTNDFRALEQSDDPSVKDRLADSRAYKSWVNNGRPALPTYNRLSSLMYEYYGGDILLDNHVREAATTSTLTTAVKNTVNIMAANVYSQRELWFEPIVRTEEVDTIDDATLARIYGVDTLDVVPEGTAYTEISLSDEEETASFVKRGNFIGITLEILMKDKIQVIRRIPQALADTWYNTQSDLVSNVFTVNSNTGPVLSDSGALFNSTALATPGGHVNLLTTALSHAAYSAARTAMRKQTDQPLGAGRRLMIRPRFLLVPVDLETTALDIRNSELVPEADGSSTTGNQTVNNFRGEFEVITVPTWTDTNNWALVADPMLWPSIHLIYPRGQRTPQIFSADNETGGSMFTNDELRFKVRLMTYRFSSTYDCAPVSDFRPLHKSNVT